MCRTSITGNFEAGQTAVRIDLIEREGGAARVQVFVPVGMFLPPGVKLRVDDSPSFQLPYTWCLANACIAAEAADPKLVAALETGAQLLLETTDVNLLALTTAAPLGSFASVHQGAPERTYEQDLSE